MKLSRKLNISVCMRLFEKQRVQSDKLSIEDLSSNYQCLLDGLDPFFDSLYFFGKNIEIYELFVYIVYKVYIQYFKTRYLHANYYF